MSSKEFVGYAKKNLILVKVDYAANFSKQNKKTLDQIEAEKKIPKNIAVRGRGPWPYLFIFDKNEKVIYSGKAYESKIINSKNYITFLKKLN